MEYDYMGEDDDLVLNTAARIAVCLCLDTSGSMNKNNGEAIRNLNRGVEKFYEYVRADRRAHDACDIAVVLFNSKVTVAEKFTSVDRIKKPNYIAPEGSGTALAHAVDKCLDMLEERKNNYKAMGIEYFQPILLLMTDGKPGDMEDLPQVQGRSKALIADNKLTFCPFLIGKGSKMPDGSVSPAPVLNILNGFCVKNSARQLESSSFDSLFRWLGKSVSRVVDGFDVDYEGFDDDDSGEWGEI